MCYMVEGGGAKSYNKAKAWLYAHPAAAHDLLQRITDVAVEYLIGQVQAGAQMLEVFDSWAGDLGPDMFTEFALPYLTQIARRVKHVLRERKLDVPITIFPKGAHYSLEAIADSTEYDCISLDWTMDPVLTRRRLQGHRRITLQGNLEPSALYGSEQCIRQQARRLIDGFGTQSYIVNLGHGMLPSHQPQSVGWLVDEIHRYSTQLISRTATSSSAT